MYIIHGVLFTYRSALKTKRNGTYIFASKDPKEVLRTVRKYVDPNNMVQSLSFFDVVKRGVKSMFKGKSK